MIHPKIHTMYTLPIKFTYIGAYISIAHAALVRIFYHEMNIMSIFEFK